VSSDITTTFDSGRLGLGVMLIALLPCLLSEDLFVTAMQVGLLPFELLNRAVDALGL
jgi:hypothetical protein